MSIRQLDVLYDGGIDHASAQYQAAVAVMRKLNEFIRQQNIDSSRSDGSDLFRIKAVEKWLFVHQSKDAPVDPLTALDLGNGSAVWKNTRPAPQNIQLMSKHRVLGFKPQLRPEWRGQGGQSEAEQPDHPASLGDSNAASHSDKVFGTHRAKLNRQSPFFHGDESGPGRPSQMNEEFNRFRATQPDVRALR
jgi:hypothetical protein